MGKFPWGRWFAVLKVVVLAPIFILAAATIVIIERYDPAEFSTGVGMYYFNYKAKTETNPKPAVSPTSQEPTPHKTDISTEHTSGSAQVLDANGRRVVMTNGVGGGTQANSESGDVAGRVNVVP